MKNYWFKPTIGMTRVIDWKNADDPRDVVHIAVQAVAEGHIVAVLETADR